MSSEQSPRGAAPAYDEAEKGTLDKVAVYPIDKKPLTFPADEKKDILAGDCISRSSVFQMRHGIRGER